MVNPITAFRPISQAQSPGHISSNSDRVAPTAASASAHATAGPSRSTRGEQVAEHTAAGKWKKFELLRERAANPTPRILRGDVFDPSPLSEYPPHSLASAVESILNESPSMQSRSPRESLAAAASVRPVVGLTLLREDLALLAESRNELAVWKPFVVDTTLSFIYRFDAGRDPCVKGMLSILDDTW